jgi:tRNA pseudouridine32 synthase/23S rRNA pseudouridine746 synthase
MRRRLRSPLPQRNGLDAVRLRTPDTGPWTTLRDHLVERLPQLSAEHIDSLLDRGQIVDRNGPLPPDTPFRPRHDVWLYRELAEEVAVPFPVTVVHRDEYLLVVDKPHFLATMPRGRHVAQTALVRLRRELDLPTLSPAHRLDRLTAGLLMFVIQPRHRGAYQSLFRDRQVHKTYEAIAPYDPALELPRTVRSRIVKERGVLAARELAGPPNAETRVELIEHRDGLGRYRLTPTTGRTHQLRVHLNGLGIPILGDPVYPTVTEARPDDFDHPLQLLATELEFVDPVTGDQRHYATRAKLAAWPGDTPPGTSTRRHRVAER